MFDVTCPFCYRRINRLRTWFVCSGRNAPGYQACAQDVDVRRREETTYEEPMYPVFPPPIRWLPSPRRARCPRCEGLTGEHACPVCHTPLPANFGGSFSPVIALVGARRTGKTVYLIVLGHHFGTVLRDRFRANVWLFGDDALSRLQDNMKAMYEDGTLPIPTIRHVNGRSEPLVFEWRRRRRHLFHRYRSSYLSFLDTAGDSLGTQRAIKDLNFLGTVDALIVVLDPFTLPGARERFGLPDAAPTAEANAANVLSLVTERIRQAEGVGYGGRSKKPLAVAFAKIDALRDYLGADHPIFAAETDGPWWDDAAGLAVHESLRELLREWGAIISMTILRPTTLRTVTFPCPRWADHRTTQ